MSPRDVLAALSAAVFVGLATGTVVRPPRRLGPRIAPYAQLSRSRLGRPADLSLLTAHEGAVANSSIGRVFGPVLAGAAGRLSATLDVGGDDALALRLRQAGFIDVSPESYRMRQLAWAVGGTVGAGFVGAVVVGSAAATLLLAAVGLVGGASYWRGRINKAIKVRRARMRLELYTVAQLLAMFFRTGRGPMEALRGTVARGRGPVVAELAEALAWCAGGMAETDALERLAMETPEPAAARLYRLLASGIAAGGDLAEALLRVSDDLRAERREDVERQATARRGSMLLPTIAVMAPVVLLFLLAPLPSVIFGR